MPEFPDREGVKFPKIVHKTKSMPNNKRDSSTPLNITAKSWLYHSPTTTQCILFNKIQLSNHKQNDKLPVSQK